MLISADDAAMMSLVSTWMGDHDRSRTIAHA